ncbi:putative florfenicol exporter [Annulohypoxylon truncatum]|uniref:putative florfenicol exporter n=1 Tax=Annulohypoxylon truncatum TaxID=327061 RepID=UPI002008403E|nr:putative florfenicol exporter [Annulohypoxylon truncatum]KAI1209033.1 putative florfenicol exporter [Annulohypoxylon truncatum]
MAEKKEGGGVMAEPATETAPPQLSAENLEEPEEQARSQDAEAEKRLARLHELYGATWDGPDDPNDPYNWAEWRKVSMGIIFSIGQLVTLMSASIMAAALDNISHDLGIGASATQITLSIYFLGLGIGPFFVAALGEMDGRRNVWIASNIWYILWNSLCPVGKSQALMIIGRFFAATGAAAGVILTGPVMADMYHAKDRGKSLAIASFLPYLGPALGPIIGGVVVQYVYWPWLFWIISIFDALIVVIGAMIIKESYTPVLLRRKAAAQSDQSGNPALSPAKWAFWQDFFSRLMTYLQRPVRLLVRRPIIQVVSLVLGLNFGIYTLMLSTFATLWIEQYKESSLISSLHYLSISIGFCLTAQGGGRIMDIIYKRLRDRPKYKGEGRPEFRAPYMIPGVLFVPAGLFWYGWSAEHHITWIMVDIGAVIFAIGSSILSQSVLAYTLDVFGDAGASAYAATRLLSNVMGFAFPIFAPQLYDRLGYGWGNSVLAFIFVALGLPVPMILWFWGKKLREMGKTHHDAN